MHAFISCSFFILRYKKLFLFAEAFKNTRKFKISIERSTYILHLLAFVEMRLFNVFFWERKAGFGKLMKNVRDAGFSRKKGREYGIRTPTSRPCFMKTAIKPKFVDRFSLRSFRTTIHQCSIKPPNFVSIEIFKVVP